MAHPRGTMSPSRPGPCPGTVQYRRVGVDRDHERYRRARRAARKSSPQSTSRTDLAEAGTHPASRVVNVGVPRPGHAPQCASGTRRTSTRSEPRAHDRHGGDREAHLPADSGCTEPAYLRAGRHAGRADFEAHKIGREDLRGLQLADHRLFVTVCHGWQARDREAPGRRHHAGITGMVASCRARRAMWSPVTGMMPLTRHPEAGIQRSPSQVLGESQCCDPGRHGTPGRVMSSARGEAWGRTVPGRQRASLTGSPGHSPYCVRGTMPGGARGTVRGTASRESQRSRCCQCDSLCHRCSYCAQ
jgi:hypothetical protein